MKVLSVPHLDQLGGGESGIHTVIRAYFRHAKDYDIEFLPAQSPSADLLAIHAGMAGTYPKGGPIVAHTHGLYWTADYEMGRWAYNANKNVVDSIRHAKEVTVPSAWVAETFERDMRFTPHVVPHGIDWEDWQSDRTKESYVIGYAKNRSGVDVCNPSFLPGLAHRFPDVTFMATFCTEHSQPNIITTGVMQHDEMKSLVQRTWVYISTTKETWGIGILEAMASGAAILAFDHGGVSELVRHGVNGYLAQPDDYEDLANGLDYCLRYKKVLGENSRELARQYDGWQEAMTKLRAVYENAIRPDPATVSIVIPVYNKPQNEFIRAIDSAIAQTVPPDEVIVVDDGSDNGVDYSAIAESRGAKFIRQENKGVAEARNTGVRTSTGKYVVCLDADDALAPEFLVRCVPPLERDNSLGIAYTGLRWTKPDGTTGISDWPGEFNYDAQVEGRNQIPTACVFRRKAFDRVGGYHSRYSPKGAGEEDANLWLRIASIGFGASKVTEEPLFLYSWQSGYVSGNREHKVTDWRYWLPWTRDRLHPFASPATPKRFSHPVRQYDEPTISVVIPVAERHAGLVPNALDSLEAQTFRKWEAIVVWDFECDESSELIQRIKLAYPYAKFHTGGKSKGAGWARNFGVTFARAPFLFYLDADDQLHPNCLDEMLKKYGVTGAAVYSDYVGKAHVEDVSKLAVNLQKDLLEHDKETSVAIIRYRSADFDFDLANAQPKNPPYHWNTICTLFPKSWHDEIGGFDESMSSWEDVDYWWRMAWAGKRFARISEPLMMYRFSTGSRRETGLDEWKELYDYLSQKRRQMING